MSFEISIPDWLAVFLAVSVLVHAGLSIWSTVLSIKLSRLKRKEGGE